MEPRKSVGNEPHYYSDRLKRKLDQIRFSPVTVVEAPSGYGKTTAIRDLLEARLPPGTPIYWYTAADETPVSGFRRLCLEIAKIDSRAGERLLKMELPNAATIGEACDALRFLQCKHETYLVIDNFQFLQAFLPPAFFTALVEHGGKGLHIIVVTQVLKRDMLAVIVRHGVLHINTMDLRLDAADIRRYYALAEVSITPEEAQRVADYTEGWIIAVYLQLRAFLEKGAFSGTPGILTLMEHLVWDRLNEEQQNFLLRLSPFEMITIPQACFLNNCDALPEYALEALNVPFIRHNPAERRYELHSLLSKLLMQKCGERGTAFARECLLRAGDLCRDEGKTLAALGFYAHIKDYERMLSLDLSPLILEEIGETTFVEIALDIARNCPEDLKKRNLLALLQVAWALLMGGMNAEFETLMKELRVFIDASSGEDVAHLRGEWTLLYSFLALPRLNEMTAALRQTDVLLQGQCSQVILPAAPWCFGNHSPLAEFHIQPGEADREAEALAEYIALYSKLTNGHGYGADVLFCAELAYHRGNLNDAEILAYKAVFLAESKQQSIVQLGATMLLAQIALHKADTAGWQNAISSMERAASFPAQNNIIIGSVLDIIRGTLLNELNDHTHIADWLQKGEFSKRSLVRSVVPNAQFVYISLMMHQGEFARLIGTAQAMYPEGVGNQPFRDQLLSLTVAVGHLSMGGRDQALALVKRAAQMGLPDGLIFPIVSYSWLLQELTGELIEQEYPMYLGRFNEIKERFTSGWTTLHNDLFANDLPPDLTAREFEVARLAAEGLHNSEIAQKLMVTESTVRAHLRTVFQKLDIDRRAKLAEKLR